MKGKEICELCGSQGEIGALEEHHIVPANVTKRAGMPESATTRLCSNCHSEVHTWYSKSIFNMGYDPGIKRFKKKPQNEMVEEYETAYRVFATYKAGLLEA